MSDTRKPPAGAGRRIKRFAYFPTPGHAYNRLFAEALRSHGIVEDPGTQFTNAALRATGPDLDGIHVHFANQLIGAGGALSQLRGLIGVIRYCRLLRQLGLTMVWTVHDLQNRPREGVDSKHTGADERTLGRPVHFCFRYFARNSDLVIVHSDATRRALENLYGRTRNVVRMPHGNFTGLFHARRDRTQTLQALGLDPSRPVLGMVGRVNEARGHALAIEATRMLPGEAQLLIAGPAANPDYARRLQQACDPARDVVYAPGRMSDADYADTVAATDVVLLPYTDITTSGALLSAWTMAKPVVMSDLPLFREFMPDDRAAGVVMARPDASGLRDAIRELLAYPADRRRDAAAAEGARYDWSRVVPPVAEAMHAAVERRRD